MVLSLEPLTLANLKVFESLVHDPSLAEEFDRLQGAGGMERLLTDPFGDPGLRWVARAEAAPAGVSFGQILPDRDGAWAMVRIGVVSSHRRQGIGEALLARTMQHIAALEPKPRECCLSSWAPNPEAAGFATTHGFRHARFIWLMERPRRPGVTPPAVAWPAGVQVRLFDGSEGAFADWTAVYNESFANHYHFVSSTVGDSRALASASDFAADGLALAYRDGRCVGFCRNELYPSRGEIGLLGVVPEARGTGLGRALLRWGIGWLERSSAARTTLMVDGENESALRLYRSEGFEVVRTREIWSRRAEESSPTEVMEH